MLSFLVNVNRQQVKNQQRRHVHRWPASLAKPELPVGSANRHGYLVSVHYGIYHVVVQCRGKSNGSGTWDRDVCFDNVPAAWVRSYFGCKLLPDGERYGHQERFGRGLVTTAKLRRALASRRDLVRPIEGV